MTPRRRFLGRGWWDLTLPAIAYPALVKGNPTIAVPDELIAYARENNVEARCWGHIEETIWVQGPEIAGGA